MRSDKPLSLCTSVFMTEYFMWEPEKDDNMSNFKNKITTKAFARDQGSISPFSARRAFGFWHRCFTSGNFVWQSRDNLAKFENMNVIHEHRKTTHVKQSCASESHLCWEFVYWVPLITSTVRTSTRVHGTTFFVSFCQCVINHNAVHQQHLW